MLTHARQRELTRRFHTFLRNRLPTIELIWRFCESITKQRREQYLHKKSNQTISKITPYLVSLAAGFVIPDKKETHV